MTLLLFLVDLESVMPSGCIVKQKQQRYLVTYAFLKVSFDEPVRP